jgi:hypothetical protein
MTFEETPRPTAASADGVSVGENPSTALKALQIDVRALEETVRILLVLHAKRSPTAAGDVLHALQSASESIAQAPTHGAESSAGAEFAVAAVLDGLREEILRDVAA